MAAPLLVMRLLLVTCRACAEFHKRPDNPHPWTRPTLSVSFSGSSDDKLVVVAGSAGSTLRSPAPARDKHRRIPFSSPNNRPGTATRRAYFADSRCRNAGGVEGGNHPINRVSCHRNQETSGGLWVEKEILQFQGDRRFDIGHFPKILAIGGKPSGAILRDQRQHTFKPWHMSSFYHQGHVARRCDFRGMADEAKPRDVGAGVHHTGRHVLQGLGSGPIQRPHRTHSLVGDCSWYAVKLDRCPDDACPNRLGQKQRVTWFCARVCKNPRRIGGTRHRVSKLDLRILHGMTAKQNHACFAPRVEPAKKDLPQRGVVECVFRKRANGQSRQGTTAHCVHIADSICSRDLPVRVWV